MNNKYVNKIDIGKPFKLYLNVQVKRAPVRLFIRVCNPNLANTCFYTRKQDFSKPSKFNYEISVPDYLPPAYLEIYTDKPNAKLSDYISFEYKIEEQKSTINNIPDNFKEDVKFIRQFSLQAGFLEPNTEHSKGRVRIKYLPFIKNPDGSMHTTPARIHKTEDFIEVSKYHFDRMPSPRRNAILFHELAHNFISSNPDSEEEADDHSADLFIASNFPPSEFIYGFSTIFRQGNPKKFAYMMQQPSYRRLHEMQVNRLKRMINKMSKK